jgi:uncharacterized damage-inducible protein DinB
MSAPILRDAFGHHVWATLTLLDTCRDLTPEQLATTVPGTYGSIIDTLRHLVGADASYLELLSGGRSVALEHEERAGIPELRAVMAQNGPTWQEVVAADLDPDLVVIRYRDDDSESHAPLGIRLAQAIHHGTDHRSQVCTALTSLGIEPPAIDVWDHADQDGRLLETAPPD